MESRADGAPDTFISKTTRLYRDSRTLTQGAGGASAGPSTQLDQLNENLQDVTRIMTKNMEDLLWRGDSLDREFPNGCSGFRVGWRRSGIIFSAEIPLYDKGVPPIAFQLRWRYPATSPQGDLY